MNTEQERAEFEAWFKETDHFLSELDFCLMPDGRYEDDDVEVAWEAYQAGRAALQSQDREDAERLDWLQQHDGRFYNLLRITSIVNKGFSPTNNIGKRWFSLIREAIDHARRIEGGNHE